MLTDFYAQRPQWRQDPDDKDLEHAEIEVPRDYSAPDGERLTIALSRRRATAPERRRGILLGVNGGPGGDWGAGRALPDRFAGTPPHEVYDLIGFDPRGTGASTPLHAEVTVPRAEFDSRPPDELFPQLAEDMRLREEACARAGGALRRHISTPNTARDIDVIRGVLGEERVTFVGYAYGAYVGAVYGTLFPDRLDRSVLDSCVHPDWTWREQFLWQGDAVLGNVTRWAEWTAERHRHFGLGDSTERVFASVEDVVVHLDGLGGGPRLRTLFDGAVGNRAADRGRWAELGTLVGRLGKAATAGDAAACRDLLQEQGTWRPADSEGSLRIGVLEAITLEHEWPADLDVYYQDMREFRKRFPYGYGVLRAQPWVGAFRTFEPAEPPVVPVRDGYPVGLVVQADGDPMDHYAGGVAMAERLGHHLLTVEDSGEHEVYVLGDNPYVDTIVHRYLVDGELPAPRATCPGRTPRPEIAADVND
ncbi:alpha/beta hydrolase [Streptomyces sp. NPDC049099]|uniref:alpha/beta hydrolase n=1 Tax=unclassified Streptomyces TaxID=2593676 RepID=UPI00341BB490